MFKKQTVIIIILATLLITSAILNIVTHNKAEKYERAADSALSYFISQYRIDSIHRSLDYQITENKLHFGQEGKLNNYNQKDFQELSIVHKELTSLYGPLFSYDEYNNISSMRENSIFNMFVDFSVFFEYLEGNYSESIMSSDGELYLNFSNLNEEILNALYSIEEISEEFAAIQSRSFEHTSREKALEDYMKQSSVYFNSSDVQLKKEIIEKVNRQLIAQLSSDNMLEE